MNLSLPKLAFWTAAALAAAVLGVVTLISGAYLFLQPSLPTVEAMRNIELQVPLRVYSRDGKVIAQIGEQRRIPVTYDEVPEMVRQAFVAAEDDRFFQHSGFDYAGILRSVVMNAVPGSRLQGASTITQQTARNLFLTQDRTWRRKVQEMFLTHRIEREFSKQEILGLYLNVISFGKRTYGVAAAADLYYGKKLGELTLAEAATLARVPQAPSRYNPISNPEAAAQRRAYVLRRMREIGYIDEATEKAAAADKVRAREHAQSFDVEAPYVAEMARLELLRRFGAAAQNEGWKIFTSIDSKMQAAADDALREGLLDYDRRHGWRGPLARATLAADAPETPEVLDEALEGRPSPGKLVPAVVVKVGQKDARLYTRESGFIDLPWEGMSWARPKIGLGTGASPKRAADVLARGDVVLLSLQAPTAPATAVKAELAQLPEASAALVALAPNDGAVRALVGGFDYFDPTVGKFNRATQARRQPGSGFKPFLYSAALENGFTASSLILDAPFVIDDPGMEEAWRPENSSGDFSGPMRLREALVKSRNLVSIRLLQAIGMSPAMQYAERFGFERSTLPRNLTLALGTNSATPLQVAAGYAVFANGGHRIQPWFIERIEDPKGQVLFQAAPRRASCATGDAAEGADEGTGCKLPDELRAPRAISAANAWLMVDMMREVITRGTGRRALALGRSDLAGKTGTTNEARDTWFNGYNRSLVASVWVGYDQSQPLGEGEEGSRTAVPIWVDFMRVALDGTPQRGWPMPDGLVQARISLTTGELASVDDPEGIFETFLTDRMPTGGILGGNEMLGPTGNASVGTVDPNTAEPIF
ncbi:MAG: penicillin-binding protein 1A [Gammaproteobacteria bacterium]